VIIRDGKQLVGPKFCDGIDPYYFSNCKLFLLNFLYTNEKLVLKIVAVIIPLYKNILSSSVSEARWIRERGQCLCNKC